MGMIDDAFLRALNMKREAEEVADLRARFESAIRDPNFRVLLQHWDAAGLDCRCDLAEIARSAAHDRAREED